MSYVVTVSYEAEEDVQSIFMYLAVQRSSPMNARRQLARIEQAIEGLDELPLRYPSAKFRSWGKRGFRVMRCDKFLIFYLVQEEKREVIISRVLYQRRDIGNVLAED